MNIDNENFIQFAFQNYNNPSCFTLKDFNNDLRIFNRLIKNIEKDDENVRLSLNYLVILFNTFGKESVNMILFKVDEKYHNKIINYLSFLDLLSEEFEVNNIFELDDKLIYSLQQM